MAPDRALVRIDDLVHRVAIYNEEMRIGGTVCALHFFAESDNQPLPSHLRQIVLDGLTNQHIGRFAWKMFDVATCLRCA